MSKSTKILRKTTAVTLAALVALSAFFSFSFTADAKKKNKGYVKSIKISPKTLKLKKNETRTVKVTVKVKGNASKKFSVKADKSKVKIKIKKKAIIVTAKKAGTVNITVTAKGKSKKGKKLKAKLNVKISAPKKTENETEPETVPIKTEPQEYSVPESGVSPTQPATQGGNASTNSTDKPVNPVVTDPAASIPQGRLEKIIVKADPEIIGIGETSKITVESGTPGAAVVRVVYKTSDANSATVDENGVITGKAATPTPVRFTVTAYDALNNAVEEIVNITVKDKNATETTVKPTETKVPESTSGGSSGGSSGGNNGGGGGGYKPPATKPPVQPTTSTTENTDPTATVETPKLTSVNVKATPSKIAVGADSWISVTPGNEGAKIKSITYRSGNTSVAKVDAYGIVTGLRANPKPITISVVAIDIYNTRISGSVEITVVANEYEDAEIEKLPADISICIKEDYKLNPVAVDAGDNPEFAFVSDDPEVASVDENGVVTGIAPGEANIYVYIAGTTAEEICAVTVEDKEVSLGITSFKAVHAKKFKLEFSMHVPEADREKVSFTIYKGNQETSIYSVFWAGDGTFVTLVLDSNLQAANYTAVISSESVAIDETRNSAHCTVEPYSVKEVSITTKRVAKINGARIYFEAVDNYGDKMENALANMFNWQISCDDAQVQTDSFGLNYNNNGFISLDNLSDYHNGVKIDDTSFAVQAIYKNDTDIRSDRVNIDVKSLKIDHIDILGVELDKGAKRIYEDSIDKNYNLIVDAVDNYGDPVDWSLYYPGSAWSAYNNEFSAYSDNTELVSAPYLNDKGKFMVTVFGGKYGKAKISIIADSPVPSVYDFEVYSAPRPLKIKFPEESNYSVASFDADVLRVPVKFEDQYGDEMAAGAVDTILFATTFTTDLSDDDLYVSYDSSKDGDFICFDSSYVDYDKSKSITVKFLTYDDDSNLVSSKFNIKVDPQRKPDSIKFTSEFPTSLVVGETVDIDFTIMDNRGTKWGSDTGLIGPLSVSIGTTDTHYIVSPYSATINSDGTGTIKIQGISDSSVNKDPNVAIELALFDGTTECENASYTPPTVVVYPQLGGSYPIQLNAAPATVIAGETITLTFQAYKDDVTKHTTYTHLYKDVTISQYDYSDPSRSKVVIRDVNFVNGVATVEIEAMVACPELVISTEIFCVGYGYVYPEAAEKVKVNPGVAVKYVVKGTYDSIYEADEFTVTCVDEYGNTVTDYFPSGNTYISAEDMYGDKIENLNAKFSGDVDSDGCIMLTFVNGVATFSTNFYAAFDVDDTITITTGDLTGSYKEVH